VSKYHAASKQHRFIAPQIQAGTVPPQSAAHHSLKSPFCSCFAARESQQRPITTEPRNFRREKPPPFTISGVLSRCAHRCSTAN